MHHTSIISVEKAIKKLAQQTGQKYTIRSSDSKIEVYDQNGNYLMGDYSGAKLANRITLLAFEEVVSLMSDE